MIMKKYLFYVLIVMFALSYTACDPNDGVKKVFFEKSIGDEGGESAQAIETTRDGGFIITGYNSSISNNDDIYLVKTNDRFGIEWSKTIGGNFRDRGYDVHQTADGGYIIVGTLSVTTQNTDMYVVRTNSKGDILWYKKIAQYEMEEGYSVKETDDGSFVIAGITKPAGETNSDFMVVKLSAAGSFVWTITYGSENPEIIRSVETTADNGLVVLGEIRYNMPELGDDSINVILIKLNSSGQFEWQKEFDHDTSGGYSKESGYFVKRTSDNGFIICASSNIIVLPNYSHNWGWLIKTDADGNTVWSSFFDDLGVDRIVSADETDGGEFIVTGRSGGTGPGRQLYLSKFSSSGSQIWSRLYSGQGSAEGLCVRSVGNFFVVAGYTSAIIDADDSKPDMYILKTDAEGNIE